MAKQKENGLLSRLSPNVSGKLATRLEKVVLTVGQVLHGLDDPIEQVYFPLDGLISVTLTMRNGDVSQIGLVGSREMAGLNAFIGGREMSHSAYTVVHAGSAVRAPACLLLAEFDANKEVRNVLLAYTQSFVAQLSQNVACASRHVLRKRLARWLLEMRDRAGSKLDLTHDSIANMLSVRRAGVTDELLLLEQLGYIQTERGQVTILDPRGLAQAACECYAVLEREYNRLLGKKRGRFNGA